MYTTKDIEKGVTFITNHLLLITEADRNGSLTLRRYDFSFPDQDFQSGIALGLASLMNHSDTRPNADFDTMVDRRGLPVVKVTAIKKIKAGSEILVDYGYDPTEVK